MSALALYVKCGLDLGGGVTICDHCAEVEYMIKARGAVNYTIGDVVRECESLRAQLAASEAARKLAEEHWRKLGDHFQSGGMYDPAFLFGCVQAETEARQQAVTERDARNVMLLSMAGALPELGLNPAFLDGVEAVRLKLEAAEAALQRVTAERDELRQELVEVEAEVSRLRSAL